MRRLIISIFAITFILLLAGCSSSGNNPGPPGDPFTPPPPDNPGGDSYQLSATIDLSRSVGHAPLPVNLYANVNGGLAPYYYRWDVNGDGWWDYGGFGVSEIGIHYASAGIYNVLMEVEDSNGQFYHATALVDVSPSGPSAIPAAVPDQGPTPLVTNLNGAASYDDDGYIVYWEWDIESDGIWDYEGDWVIGAPDNAIVSVTYNTPGTYNATLRVTDDDGLKSESSIQIIAL